MSDGLLILLPLLVAWLPIVRGEVDHPAWLVGLASVQSFTLVWSKRLPLSVLIVVTGLEATLVAYDMELLVGFLAAAYGLGRWGGRLQQRAGLAFGTSLLALGMVAALDDGSSGGYATLGIGGVAVMFVGFWAVGWLEARQRSRIRQLRTRSRQLEADRERAELRAAERERSLLARELHDILNHATTTMVLEATAAAETGDEAEARAALARIAETGRGSLAELRLLLGVLRQEPADDPLDLPPRLDQLERLVGSTPTGGPRVRLERRGDVRPVAASIELAVYRVVQESLTNVVKHAGAVDVGVTVTYEAASLAVRVVNSAPGRRVNAADGSGLGLVGMRQRVELLGGSLAAARRPDGGFEVSAVLPLPT